MSRTSLSRAERGPDYYPTPAWCVRRLLEAVSLPGGFWLEPAVGDGAIVRAVDEMRDDVRWTTVDIRPETRADVIADFAWCHCPELDSHEPARGVFDVVVTNPPYGLAEAFVAEARARAPVVAMLLRLNWLAGIERSGWLAANVPDVYVLPDRPSFTGAGTDATDYGWLVWPEPGVRRRGSVQILATTPAREKRAA